MVFVFVRIVDLRYFRLHWIRQFVADWQTLPAKQRVAFAEFSTLTGVEFAGATLMVARQLRA